MPELPEVETIKNYLERHIIGSTINNYSQKRGNIRYILDNNLKELIEYTAIISLRRRAKYLIIDLSNDYSIILHLGMTGRITLENLNYKDSKHDHIVLFLSEEKKLIFNDSRRFGMLYCVKTSDIDRQKFISGLGPEPLLPEFNPNYLQFTLKNIKSPIKNALMNNKIVVGVGNIYASESLFLAKINPTKNANRLSIDEINNLTNAVKRVLLEALEAKGTTLKDFVSGDGKPGFFQQKLRCYDRENLPCKICEVNIVKIKQAGRATYYCVNCQN